MFRQLYFTIIFFLFLKGVGEAQELPLIHYTADSEINALPSAMVTHVLQDRAGFIWMSVFSTGLIRFDGARMEVYNQQDGLMDLGVWEILEDEQGFLWVSSNAGLVVSEKPVLSYQNGERLKFISEIGGTPLLTDAITLNQMTMDQLGRIWVGSLDKGFFRYKNDTAGNILADTVFTGFSDNNINEVIAVQRSEKGDVIAALSGGKLAEFKDQKILVFYESPEKRNDQNFVSIHEDKEGRLWAYRQNGEILFFINRSSPPQLIAKEQASNISGITALSDGNIWATNGVSGIARINQKTGEKIGSYTRANGLLSNNVFHVMEDREKNVWIAQSGGVSKLRYNYNAFENFSARSIAGERPILPSGKVNTVFIPKLGTSPCRFWVGTEGGATCVSDTGESEYLTQEDGLIGDWVNGIVMDASGRLWIATTEGLSGIVFDEKLIPKQAFNLRKRKIFDAAATIFSIPDSPPFIAAENLRVYSLNKNEHKESVWFPGLGQLFGIVEDEFYAFDETAGLPPTLYKAVAFDDQGYLWIGTLDKGIYRSTVPLNTEDLRQKSLEINSAILFEPFWSKELDAPTNHIEKLLWHNDKMWVGTQEGLFALDPEKGTILNHISSNEGLPADNSVSFSASPITGHIWVGTNQGLAELDPVNFKIVKTVSRQDGLIDNEVWLYGSVQVDEKGQIYFGTANGLSIYHPELDMPNLIPPILQLTDVVISYQAEGRNEVIFEYAALSFSKISGVRYRTRLIGYDENWSHETVVRRLRYTNLPAYFWPKSFTLEIMAINESGVEAEQPLQYTFFIEPVWWLQWWAFLLYVVILGAFIIFVDRFQRARLIKKERDIARLREAELLAETANEKSKAAEAQASALKAENEKKALELEKVRELEIAYHELKAAQNQLIQAEKMASLGRLATGIAHEIKNPLNFINNFAELSVELVDELNAAIKASDMEEIGYVMENLKHNTTKIEEHGKRADAIVRSMMQHTRSGKSKFELVDVNQLVEQYTDLAYHGKRAQIQGLHVTIIKELQPDLEKIKGVGQELGQVLINIIGNSLDAVWDHKFHLNNDDKPKIWITTRNKGKHVEIKIADNGPGVPEAIREKIFEPFFTTKPTGAGTGLGLSLSYDIITQGHNGKLFLENNSGKGATFIILLPAS